MSLSKMLRVLCVLAILFALGPARADGPGAAAPRPENGPYFSGQLLIAGPAMPDPRFSKTVIYLADHDADGAFGLVLNRPIGQGPVEDFLIGLGMEIAPSEEISGEISVHSGGPVEPGAGFVLHTNDYQTESTAMLRGSVAVSASLKAVKDIGLGHGPRRHLVMLGYAGWGPRQLESEMRRGDWEITPYDEDLVFGTGMTPEEKWQRAREASGIPL